MSTLKVFFEQQLVGQISEDRQGIGFQYDSQWLDLENNFAISHSLPIGNQYYLEEGENFFTNLLPEGGVRESLCRQFGISIDNDMALLERIGHECAGALTISNSIGLKTRKKHKQEITVQELSVLLENELSVYAGIQENKDFPFSLAGAQDKIPIQFEKNKFYRPNELEPSTHILKFAQKRFKFVPENEFICSLMLAAYGLPVPNVNLVKFNSQYHLLVERYDRKEGRRLHQEDFCQAMGISQKKKYENDGGPSFQKLSMLLSSISRNEALDIDLLIRWQILNTILGNCDGHAKNLSLLMPENNRWELSPFYDVVTTMIYPKISKSLAFSIGGQKEIGNLHANHWRSFFESVQVNSTWYIKKLIQMCDQAPVEFENIRHYFESEYGKCPVLDLIGAQIHENIRRIKVGILVGS